MREHHFWNRTECSPAKKCLQKCSKQCGSRTRPWDTYFRTAEAVGSVPLRPAASSPRPQPGSQSRLSERAPARRAPQHRAGASRNQSRSPARICPGTPFCGSALALCPTPPADPAASRQCRSVPVPRAGNAVLRRPKGQPKPAACAHHRELKPQTQPV